MSTETATRSVRLPSRNSFARSDDSGMRDVIVIARPGCNPFSISVRFVACRWFTAKIMLFPISPAGSCCAFFKKAWHITVFRSGVKILRSKSWILKFSSCSFTTTAHPFSSRAWVVMSERASKIFGMQRKGPSRAFTSSMLSYRERGNDRPSLLVEGLGRDVRADIEDLRHAEKRSFRVLHCVDDVISVRRHPRLAAEVAVRVAQFPRFERLGLLPTHLLNA